MADLGEQRSIIDNEITLDTFFYFFFSMIKISIPSNRLEIFVDNNSGIILEISLYIYGSCVDLFHRVIKCRHVSTQDVISFGSPAIHDCAATIIPSHR